MLVSWMLIPLLLCFAQPTGPSPSARSSVCWAAPEAMCRSKEDLKAVQGWLNKLKHPDRALRAQAAEAVGNFGRLPKDALPLLTEALRDPAEEVRLAALRSFSKLGSMAEPAVPEIVRLIKDQGLGKVALAAQLTLGCLKGHAKIAIPALIEPLTVPDEYGATARQRAPLILEGVAVTDRRIQKVLSAALHDRDGVVRAN